MSFKTGKRQSSRVEPSVHHENNRRDSPEVPTRPKKRASKKLTSSPYFPAPPTPAPTPPAAARNTPSEKNNSMDTSRVPHIPTAVSKREIRSAARPPAAAAAKPPAPPIVSPPLALPPSTLSFADRALGYFEHLGQVDFSALSLPPRVKVVNPYSDPEVLRVMNIFLREYCSPPEEHPRVFLFGINPGRFGAGITGIPFTDPIVLRTKLKIESSFTGGRKEASGEFIWQVIDSLGIHKFFSRYWITSLFPLCLLKDGTNYNFYDDPKTFAALRPFILRHMEEQRGNLGASPSVAICIGTGQNQRALQEINSFYHLFDSLLCVEHPRFIVQYRRSSMHAYLEKYVKTLENATNIAMQSVEKPDK